MKIGLHVVSFSWPDAPTSIAPTLAAVAHAAEEAGIDELTLMDHWFQMEAFAPPTEPMLEGYTSLGYPAAHTDTGRYGCPDWHVVACRGHGSVARSDAGARSDQRRVGASGRCRS
jgi:hypothetical protein